MRYVCVAVLFAWTAGSADVFVADAQQPAGSLKGAKPREQPLADIPKEFQFLFYSFEQFEREYARQPTLEDLWKGLPYDSVSFERGGTGGCIVACASSTVTLYRATVSGIRAGDGELRGRAELRTVEGAARALRISEGSVRIHVFANLSYLLHRARFLDLPDEYACRGCPADRMYAVLSVAAGGKTKTVVDYGVQRPVELWAIQQAFDSVSKSIQWTQK